MAQHHYFGLGYGDVSYACQQTPPKGLGPDNPNPAFCTFRGVSKDHSLPDFSPQICSQRMARQRAL